MFNTNNQIENSSYPLYVSDTKKRANDYALAKDFMDYFDMVNPINTNRVRRIQENFELHAGRWKNIEEISPTLSLSLGTENIVLGSGKLNHYPIIDRFSKSVVSDLQIAPLIPIIRDNSSKARNFRERIRLERVKSFFQNTIIQPKLQEITQQYDQQNGIIDVISLPIEAQRQRQFDIDRRLREETPEEVFNAMERMNTPDELVAEALFKEGMRYAKVRRRFGTGAENAVVTGEEYYRAGIVNKMPYVEALNPKWVVWGGSEHVEFAEDGQFAKYEQYLTPEDVMTKYSYALLKKDVKNIEQLYTQIPGYSGNRSNNYKNDGIQRTLVDLFANNPELQNEVNPRTREGQQKLQSIYAGLTHYSREGFGVKESYITWRWMRRAKFVTRLIDGKIETFIRGEHYQKDPLAGDIRVVERPIPQTWHGVKLGEEIYTNVGPIEYQYNNIEDPFDVKLGIYGGKYNTYQNNVKNASLIDLGKPWQYRYNVQMKKMVEHQATDIGKVFLGTTSMLPKGWTWAQWYKSLFVGRTAIVSNHREGINNLDSGLFKSIDLGRSVDIGNDIKQLEYVEQKIATSMYYSQEKIGNISQYATNQNTQIALQGVDRQMYRFHERHRMIKENVLNAFLKIVLYAYKDNETVKSTVLDDFLRAHYELNFNTTDYPNFTLHIVDDFEESEKLRQMRELALTFLQNGMTGGQLAALMDADSIAEMKQFLEDVDRQKSKADEEAFKREESLIEKQRQSAEAQAQLQQQFIAMENDRDRQVKLRMAELNSMQMANAVDVDDNKVNDSLQKAYLEIGQKERSEERRLRQEARFKEYDVKLQNRKLDIEEKKAKSKKS